MNRTKTMFTVITFGLLIQLLTSSEDNPKQQLSTMIKKSNPVVYFEIPVTELDRAITFYKAVFDFDFTKEVIDHNEMALFPFFEINSGISGALAKGKTYKPTKDGVIIYFNTMDIDSTLSLVIDNGGKISYQKTSIGELGTVAEFEDSEGNRIALHQPNE